MEAQTERGAAPVSPPKARPRSVEGKPRRKPPQRGKAGGRTVQKNVSLTVAENTILEAKAAEAGLSVASYLRASALSEAGPRARRAPTIEKQALGAAIAELNRVGNNINQIARALNIGKDYDDEFLRHSVGEMRGVLTALLGAINV